MGQCRGLMHIGNFNICTCPVCVPRAAVLEDLVVCEYGPKCAYRYHVFRDERRCRFALHVPRNHPHMVSCTLYDTSRQRANSETQVIVDSHTLHEYVLKYESKAEKKGVAFVATYKTVLRNMAGGARCERFAPVDALLGRLVNISIKERFLVPKSLLATSNSTLCPRNVPKMPQNAPKFAQFGCRRPKPTMGRILGYVAQNPIPRARTISATAPLLQ